MYFINMIILKKDVKRSIGYTLSRKKGYTVLFWDDVTLLYSLQGDKKETVYSNIFTFSDIKE